jgi:3-methyladenine DNA glycosylase/8-oxoguanine DNA glycosylase
LTTLEFSWPIDLRLTVAGHGWAQLAPWRWDGETLSRAERVGARGGTLSARQDDARRLAVAWDGFAEADGPELCRRMRRWVSADWDPAPAFAALAPALPEEAALLARGGGRLLRCSSLYEDFVKTVLTINTTWDATCRMAAALVAEPGGGFFPEPAAILDYGEARLRERARLGFRAPTVIAATARLVADGVVDNEALLDHDYLTGLKGIGPYAAAHCRMLLHDFARIPVDTVVTGFVRERFGCAPAEFIAAHAGCGDYLGLAYRLMRLREKFAGAGSAY